MSDVAKFTCRICNKEKSRSFAFTVDLNSFNGLNPCPDCGKVKQLGVFVVGESWKGKMVFVGCLECNPEMNNDENIWVGDRVCHNCFSGWKGKKNSAEISKILTNSLIEEECELCQELTEVKKQLNQVLEELEKLKSNSKDNKKLEQQIVQNEKLMKDSENISAAEAQEQINKSKELIINEKMNNAAAFLNKPNKDNEKERKIDKNNLDLKSCVVGGLVVAVSSLVLVGCLLARKKLIRKINN